MKIVKRKGAQVPEETNRKKKFYKGKRG